MPSFPIPPRSGHGGPDLVVAARAAHFRAVVQSAGGPPVEVDAAIDTLDDWWKWFLKRFRLPRVATTVQDLQRASALPDWYEQRRLPALELGNELVTLLDGLAAHVAEVLQRAEPGSAWVREKDPWFSQPISKLSLPRRPSVPVDIVVVDLGYTALKSDEIARRPTALRDLVERCLAIGDPRPRLFASLTRSEAVQVLDEVIAGHQARTEQLLAQVNAAGGPARELDFTMDSLVPLWRWLVKRQRLPKVAAMDSELRRHHPAWWYDYWPRYAQLFGADLSALATSVADYAAACVMRVVPRSAWALGADRLSDLRQPVLRVADDTAFSVHEDTLSLMWAALSGRTGARQPDAFLNLVQRWVRAAHETSSREAPASNPFRIIVIRNEPFDYQITLADEVAWDEGTTTSFIASLRSDARLERVVHEDREVILVATRLEGQAFREAAAAAWESSSSVPPDNPR